MASKKAQELELTAVLESQQGGSMIADAITRAAELGEAQARAAWSPVLQPAGLTTETERYYLQQLAPDAPAEVVKLPLMGKAVAARHASVGSFCDWVQRRTGAGAVAPEVFVANEIVSAKWNLGNHLPQDGASLPLEFCEAWRGLQLLIAGVAQQPLHKLLTTVLHGHIDEKLAHQIALLSSFTTQNCDVAISHTGLADVNQGERMTLHFTGGSVDDKEQIGVEWVYTGPVWTCYAEEIVVPLRMVISKAPAGGLFFEFAPLNLEALLLGYRRSLAATIEDHLGEAGIPVYLGAVSG